MLMIGDLSQLAPVVKDSEWALLREYYRTPYFFGSHALQQTQHVTIEFTHVYRQTDHTFINILNEVRENRLTAESLARLNSRVAPSSSPKGEYLAQSHPPLGGQEGEIGRASCRERVSRCV